MSRDPQVAEVALSLSDFNPSAKMAPNPDLLFEMRQGAREEVMVCMQRCVCVCMRVCLILFDLDQDGGSWRFEVRSVGM